MLYNLNISHTVLLVDLYNSFSSLLLIHNLFVFKKKNSKCNVGVKIFEDRIGNKKTETKRKKSERGLHSSRPAGLTSTTEQNQQPKTKNPQRSPPSSISKQQPP